MSKKNLQKSCEYVTISNLRAALIYARRRIRLSQTECALNCSMSSAMISKFEEGKVKNMTLKTFLKICIVLGFSPNDMLGWENDRHPRPEKQERISPYFLNHDFNMMIK